MVRSLTLLILLELLLAWMQSIGINVHESPTNRVVKSKLQAALNKTARQEKKRYPHSKTESSMRQQYDLIALLFQEVNTMKDLKKNIRSDHMKDAINRLSNNSKQTS